jgi:hypothetical protein
MHYAFALPVLIVTLTMPITIWVGMFAVWAEQRASGRRAVEAELKRLGEHTVSIENVPSRELAYRAGLVSACVFRVAARARDGSARTHLWAYEPGLAARFGGPGGLKRLAHGIWIPA